MDIKVILLVYFFIMTLIGLYSMYSDKRKAAMKKWRTPEIVLLAIALAGGALGSTIGMRTFKHKTKKRIFSIGLPSIVLVYIIGLGAYIKWESVKPWVMSLLG